ncbi:hypothetical protein K402DRAFT_467708 [Aulographum hederae CBS 113979]|uniref:Nuclear pore assembly and biogenesis-domain-containing protein n=1 Tax=Aulographum hederae CBS 113979 TaxID=1176131 RepID=A0A6G1GK88_9PEZI|nr:hypothetical protein K402DRAFT_467708 [Aulographum hederae CBS 113979]
MALPETMEFLQNYLHNQLPAPVSSLVSTVRSAFLPILTYFTSQKPDLFTIALLALTLYLSLQVLSMLTRAVLFWVRLFIRLAFWAAIVGLGLWIYTRGVDGVVEDVSVLWGTWQGEYEFWKERAEVAQQGYAVYQGGRGGARAGNNNKRGRGW